MLPSARLLLVERDALLPLLAAAPDEAFARPTVCTGWSVRDVLAHCAAALTAAATGGLHRFTPEDNQRDVDERRSWPLARVLDELEDGYEAGALAIDAAGGRLDGIAIGEWVHGGDVREPLGAADAYASPGIDIALDLLVERSRRIGRPGVAVTIAGRSYAFGADEQSGRLECDPATFVRLVGGRDPDPARYRLDGVGPADLLLFS